MKLVDILARELKVWPEGVHKLAQSFAGMVFYQDSAQQIVPLGRMEISDDFRDEHVTRAEWQAAVDALNAPKVVEWDGKGNPPAGSTCQIRHSGWDAGSWKTADIKYISSEYLIIRHGNFKREQHFHMPDIQFRPILTAEQVAAEERKSEILEMIDTFGTDTAIWGRDAVMEICGHLWESGYRKDPKPCGS